MAVIGTTWATGTWISAGGWALNTWGPAQEPSDRGPVCGTVSEGFAVLGTVSIDNCGEGGYVMSPGNDTPFRLTGAQDESDMSYINDATVTFTLYARNGTTVLSGPIAMPYIPASNGNYRGILQSSVLDAFIADGKMEVGLSYPVKITLADGSLDAEWDAKIPLVQRGWTC